MSETVANFNYNSSNNTLSWNAVQGADEYLIAYTLKGHDDWCIAYNGPNTSCLFNQATGTYKVKGREGKTGNMGGWGLVEEIIVP